jgi:hypothetical protein
VPSLLCGVAVIYRRSERESDNQGVVVNTKRRTTRMGLVAIAASSALVLGACGGGGGETSAGQQPQPPAAQSGGNTTGNASGSSCVAASQVLNNTQSYAGKPVTVTGTVGQVVSQHAFTVAINDNNPNTGATNNAQTLLAVRKDTTQLAAGSPVQVTGTLQPTFDPNQAATFTGGNLGQGAFTPFNGRPYVQAEFTGPISANLTGANQGGGILPGGNNCAAASDVLNNMQAYTGKQVTIIGTVAQVLGSHAVTVASTGNTTGNNAQPVLAVAKEFGVTNQTAALTPGSPVQVTGTLQPNFDMNQAMAFAGSNLGRETFAPFNGKPYLQAAYAGPVSANLSGSQR